MRVRTLQKIDERDGGIPFTYAKDTVWNVSKERAEEWCTSTPPLAKLEPDIPLGKVKLSLSVSKSEKSVTVSAYASPSVPAPEGAVAQLRIESVSGVRQLGGPLPKTWVQGTCSVSFERAATAGTVVFLSQCTGFEGETGTVEIPALEGKSEKRKSTSASEE